MQMRSKIKSLFDSEFRHYQAAICDTKRIENNQEKMDLLIRMMKKHGLKFEGLGGATNRYVAMIDGYAIKFAVDRQGFKDNLMEYSLSCEMQPWVTRSYETNGYILVQKCIRTITVEEWRIRKTEILKILDILGREYLIGDVGYNDINMANWGVDDDGELRILDYAYCHRLNENLFICPVCGSLLSYDSNYVNLLCTDRANCHEKYSYNQIKAIQGEKIDWDMIEERKFASVHIPEGQDFVEVDADKNKLLDSRTVIVRSYDDLARYKRMKEEEERKMVCLDLKDQNTLNLLLELATARVARDGERVKEIEKELYKDEKPKLEPIKCVIDPEFQERMEMDRAREAVAMSYGYDYDVDKEQQPVKNDKVEYSFDSLLARMDACRENHDEEDEIAELGFNRIDPYNLDFNRTEETETETSEDLPEDEAESDEEIMEVQEEISDEIEYTDEPVDYYESGEGNVNMVTIGDMVDMEKVFFDGFDTSATDDEEGETENGEQGVSDDSHD